jgi:hypothetical protein
MITKQSDGRTLFIEIQPGDGTRYEFLIQDYNTENLWIGGSLMTGYLFRKDSIRDAAGAVKDHDQFQNSLINGTFIPYVGYVAEHNQSRRDIGPKLWIARAMILAADHAMDIWDAEDEEIFEALSNR